jgi:hypothetical protein
MSAVKIKQQTMSLAALTVLLAACGGSSTDGVPPVPAAAGMRAGGQAVPSQGAAYAPAEYSELVQRIYLAYLGRPADFRGIGFWQDAFSKRKLPLDVANLIGAYSTDDAVKQVIDSFAAGAESQALYTGNNAAYINTIYRNIFNREVEPGGLAFWSGFLDRGELTRGQVVLWILNGGENEDAIVKEKKLQASNYFSTAVGSAAKFISAYDGDASGQMARELLGSVTAASKLAEFRPLIDASLASLVDSPNIPAIARYSGFNYLQDMGGAPAYSAYYRYPGAVTPTAYPRSGSVAFGGGTKTLNWTRVERSNAFDYAAPVTASMHFAVADESSLRPNVLPPVAMFCQAVAGTPGRLGKSTDILVENRATALSTAGELANQRFDDYRENCAVSGEDGAASRAPLLLFDGSGNAVVSTPAGSSAYPASAVTQALNGQYLRDASTGKYLTLRAYRIGGSGVASGLVVVAHQADALSGLKDGNLGLWTQR